MPSFPFVLVYSCFEPSSSSEVALSLLSSSTPLEVAGALLHSCRGNGVAFRGGGLRGFLLVFLPLFSNCLINP